MSYKPPFARMRAIKRAAPAKQNIGRTPVVAPPKNVEEALEAEAPAEDVLVEEPVTEEPAPEVEEAAPETPDDTPEPESGGVGDDTEPSMDMKRPELDALAESVGVANPDKLPNKKAVIDAIHEAQGGA